MEGGKNGKTSAVEMDLLPKIDWEMCITMPLQHNKKRAFGQH